MKPKTLYLDFETSPIIGCTWVVYDAEVFHILKDVNIISVAWSWDDEEEVYCISLPEFKGYKPGWMNVNDKKLVESFIPIFDRAEQIVAHNGKGFDFKLWRTRLIVHGFPPYPDMVEIDTKQWAKRFRFSSNRQDNVLRQLGSEERKMETDKNLHYYCLEKGERWDQMIEYNKQDVRGLKDMAKRMAPFVLNHSRVHIPPVGLVCRNSLCGSTNLKRTGGARPVKGGKKNNYLCTDCWTRTPGPIIKEA